MFITQKVGNWESTSTTWPVQASQKNISSAFIRHTYSISSESDRYLPTLHKEVVCVLNLPKWPEIGIYITTDEGRGAPNLLTLHDILKYYFCNASESEIIINRCKTQIA